MKHLFFILIFLSHQIAFPQFSAGKQSELLLAFEENKGQVHDQNGYKRQDVLFKGESAGFNYFFRNNGFSYQQSKLENWGREENDYLKNHDVIANKITSYRIDLNWINCNSDVNITTKAPRKDYCNYYLFNSIALNVKSYEELYYVNLYKGINVKWYHSSNHLKYDYIVAAGADYKQIKLEISGYKKLRIDKSGDLIIETPLGKITEQAPVVIQRGRILKAKWILTKNLISFEIENVDPDYEFVIDPVVRIWGSYYGGSNGDGIVSSSTNTMGDIIFSGNTGSSSNIATTGAHQSVFTVGGAFLAKFDTNGVRIWATYYTGSAPNSAYGCHIGPNGDVYLVGLTGSSNGIATSGAHQTVYAGGNYDAFLAKFNSSGVRQWGTYYGGTDDDQIYGVREDNTGNVIISGVTKSTTGIATPGSHLSTFAGGVDAFLAKFDMNGTRLWGTYYGGINGEISFGCTTDMVGNIFMSGQGFSSTGIGTAGAHQPSFGGGIDLFLVKFDPLGVRQWGTYYGGANNEETGSCMIDNSGNLYLLGKTSSTNNIATSGAYQTSLAGVYDFSLTKFDNNGVRLWGTYYGGPQSEHAGRLFVDGNGNVSVAGQTSSTIGIATPNAYQLNYAGFNDAFVAKFNTNGAIQWGTYYGGINGDYGQSTLIDLHGAVYLFGETQSTPGLSTLGSHQYVHGGINDIDGFLVKFKDCPAFGLSSAVSSSVICSGNSLNFSSSASTTIAINYNWIGPNSFTSNIQNPIISNASVLESGTYIVTVKNNNTGCNETNTLNIIVNSTPTISVNSGSICAGQIFTMSPSGASTYTYSNGSQTVSPTSSTVYSVVGTSTAGCTSTAAATSSISVYALPNVIITSTLTGAICNGDNTTLISSGADFYTWSTTATGSLTVVSPSITTTYSITGTDVMGCTNNAAQTVSVYPIFNLSVSASPSIICDGQSVTLSVSGATSYAWSNGSLGSVIIDSPTVTTTYTINSTDGNGCNNSTVFTMSVTDCTFINKAIGSNSVIVFPNPASDMIFIENSSKQNLVIEIYSNLGQIILTHEIQLEKEGIELSKLSPGIYCVRITDSHGVSVLHKLIKE